MIFVLRTNTRWTLHTGHALWSRGPTGWAHLPVSIARRWLLVISCVSPVALEVVVMTTYGCHQWRQSWHHNESQLERHKTNESNYHDDVIKWNNFPRYWPFVRGIHRTKASDAELWWFLDLRLNKWLSEQSRHHRTHYDVTVMLCSTVFTTVIWTFL